MPKGVLSQDAAHRCVAHKRDGERCKKAAIRGATVCRSHGGATPQVQRKARERFNDNIDPMIETAARYIKDAAEGKLDPMEALAWAKFVADRTGFVPGKTNIHVEGPPLWEQLLTPQDGQIPILRQIQPGDIEDAEVVDDGENELERHEREEAERRQQAYREGERDRARAALPHIPRTVDPPNRWEREDEPA